jgi:hypothetical protein
MFESLNTGDKIAVVESFALSKHVVIRVVTRITAAQIHVGDEKFRRINGMSVGHRGSSRKSIVDVDDRVVLDSLAREKLRRVLYEISRRDSTYIGQDGALKMLGEIRDEVDAAIELISDGERLTVVEES